MILSCMSAWTAVGVSDHLCLAWQCCHACKNGSPGRSLSAVHAAGPGGCEAVVWILLATLLSDVLNRPQWLQAWDHLVAAPPQHMQRMAAALLMSVRKRLLAARGARNRLALLRGPTSLDMQQVCQALLGMPCYTMHCP